LFQTAIILRARMAGLNPAMDARAWVIDIDNAA